MAEGVGYYTVAWTYGDEWHEGLHLMFWCGPHGCVKICWLEEWSQNARKRLGIPYVAEYPTLDIAT